jgi:8-oxo-dGTP diphosphatase
VEQRGTVVAAVIERNGLVLIAQRRLDDAYPLKWEFPGGKVEPGETPEVALRRELAEELGIDAAIGRIITSYSYRYPGRDPILLVFHDVREYEGETRNLVFEQVRWERREKLPEYDFLDGDVEFVRKLARGEL